MLNITVKHFFDKNISKRLQDLFKVNNRACDQAKLDVVTELFFKHLQESLDKYKAEDANFVCLNDIIEGVFHFEGAVTEEEVSKKRDGMYDSLAKMLYSAYAHDKTAYDESSYVFKIVKNVDEFILILRDSLQIGYYMPSNNIARNGIPLTPHECQLWAKWMNDNPSLQIVLTSFPKKNFLKELFLAKTDIQNNFTQIKTELQQQKHQMASDKIFQICPNSEKHYDTLLEISDEIITLNPKDHLALKKMVFVKGKSRFDEANFSLTYLCNKEISFSQYKKETESSIFWKSISENPNIDSRKVWETLKNYYSMLNHLKSIAIIDLIINFNRMYFISRFNTEITRLDSRFEYGKRNVLTALIQELSFHASIKGADHCSKVAQGLYTPLKAALSDINTPNIIDAKPNEEEHYLIKLSEFSKLLSYFLINFLESAYSIDRMSNNEIDKEFMEFIESGPWNPKKTFAVQEKFSGMSIPVSDHDGELGFIETIFHTTPDTSFIASRLKSLDDCCYYFLTHSCFHEYYSSQDIHVKKSIEYIAHITYPKFSHVFDALNSIRSTHEMPDILTASGYYSSRKKSLGNFTLSKEHVDEIEEYLSFEKALFEIQKSNKMNYTALKNKISKKEDSIDYNIQVDDTISIAKIISKRTLPCFEEHYWNIFKKHGTFKVTEDEALISCSKNLITEIPKNYNSDILKLIPQLISKLTDKLTHPESKMHHFIEQINDCLSKDSLSIDIPENAADRWIPNQVDPVEARKLIKKINEHSKSLDSADSAYKDLFEKIHILRNANKIKPHTIMKLNTCYNKLFKGIFELYDSLQELEVMLENVPKEDVDKKNVFEVMSKIKLIVNTFTDYQKETRLNISDKIKKGNTDFSHTRSRKASFSMMG